MRRRTITLVVVGLVLALFVLPAAAQALIGDEPETAEVTVDQEVPYLTYGYDEDSHVVFYGIGADESADLDCEIPDDATLEVVFGDEGEITEVKVTDPGAADPQFELSADCIPVLIEGPNGQVNHGQFVSTMVHELKKSYDKEAFGPFGQFLKDIKHDGDIGKGDLKVKANEELGSTEPTTLDADDVEDDDHGPNENSKKPKKNK